ncbi:hypothetical protein VPH35_044319 [Triticum aestivum]
MSASPAIASLPPPSPPYRNSLPHPTEGTSSPHPCAACLYSARHRRHPVTGTAHRRRHAVTDTAHRCLTTPSTPTPSRCLVATPPPSLMARSFPPLLNQSGVALPRVWARYNKNPPRNLGFEPDFHLVPLWFSFFILFILFS